MGTVQRVRFRAASPIARYWEIAPEAIGELMCRYRVPKIFSANLDRVDVRFRPNRIIWGIPATELEMLADGGEASLESRAKAAD